MVIDNPQAIGQKARNLKILSERFPDLVPPFIVVEMGEAFLNWEEVLKTLNTSANAYLSGDLTLSQTERPIEQTLASLQINRDYMQPLENKLHNLGFKKVSYRTSALQEDLRQSSFAGQYVTFLDQGIEVSTIESCIRGCATSLFSSRVLKYVKEIGQTKLEQEGSVIIQQMFYGTASGVLFTENGHNEMDFSYTLSWKNVTVEGSKSSSFRLPKTALNKVGQLPVSLPKTMVQVLEAAILLERQEGKPLDIEWSVSRKKAALLQFRPITKINTDYTLEWDNTNIAESYPGVTLPLTYTFIRGLYSRVYPEFLKLLGISETTLTEKKYIFENMLGYLQGRVYYNINNWYELIKLIPGYKYNKEFFEAMLMPAKKRTVRDQDEIRKNWKKRIYLGVTAIRFIWLLLRTDRLSNNFTERYLARYTVYKGVLWKYLTADEIIKTFNRIEQDLLQQWAIPILNDFRTMVFHGLLRQLFFPKGNDENYSQLLSGIYDQTSVEPVRQLGVLAKKIRPLLKRYTGSEKELINEIKHDKKYERLRSSISLYLTRYGGRSPDELKLENPRLAESFSGFVAFLITIAKGSKELTVPYRKASHEKKILKAVTGPEPFIKKLIKTEVFRFILLSTKNGISMRERFRFYRAQVFALARSAYLALGNRFVEAGLIKQRDDIFWLTKNEIDNLILGHAVESSTKETIEKRKRLYQTYATKKLGRRAISSGLVAAVSVKTDETGLSKEEKRLSGLGVSKGQFKGKVVVLRKFDPEADVSGKILVTEHTDPGWTLLFLNAAAIVVERGNALSHASIVARELGIPAIVGIEGVCDILKNDREVLVNGSTGELTLL